MESLTIPYFIVKGEFLMVIVLAVILVAVCVTIYVERRDLRAGSMNRDDVPEEVLARMMLDEYPQYRRTFKEQDSVKFAMITPRF